MLMPTQTLEPASAGAAARDLPPLVRHALLDPPREGYGDHNEVRVWRPVRQALDGGDTLLTMRYLAVQTMQVRLDLLFNGARNVPNPVFNAFVAGRFDHVYLDSESFARFAASPLKLRGAPDRLPACLDVESVRLVIDASRFFEPDRSRVTAEGRAAVVAVAESQRLARCIARHLPAQDGAGVHPLLEAARDIARYVVAEVAPPLPPLARDLAQRVGTKLVVRALLAGWIADVHAVMTAFEPRWKEIQPQSDDTQP